VYSIGMPGITLINRHSVTGHRHDCMLPQVEWQLPTLDIYAYAARPEAYIMI